MTNYMGNSSISRALKQSFLIAAIAAIFILAGSLQVSAQRLPSAAKMQEMLRQTTLDFADAVEAGDFTQFRDNASGDFQSTFTADQLREVFQVFIDKRDELLPSLRSVARRRAQFVKGPLIRTEKGYKILVANGTFPTAPYKTNFQMEYEWVNGAWELLTVKFNM